VFEPWVERPPLPVDGLDVLTALCPEDGLVDIVAVRRG
jgi:hypothetical protein